MRHEFTHIDADYIARAIRASYGKCGFDSVFMRGGHGITGVIEIYEP